MDTFKFLNADNRQRVALKHFEIIMRNGVDPEVPVPTPVGMCLLAFAMAECGIFPLRNPSARWYPIADVVLAHRMIETDHDQFADKVKADVRRKYGVELELDYPFFDA